MQKPKLLTSENFPGAHSISTFSKECNKKFYKTDADANS